jgi:cyclopropane fatty-acyl-phospholipid synthase-like methyltransferase
VIPNAKEYSMSESNWTPADVAEVYDQSTPTADVFNNGYEHMGYWYDDDDDASVDEAAARLTRKIVDPLGLRRGEHVLDAGCGAGTPAALIAREYGVQVTGVTLSSVGAGMAEARVRASGVSDQVRIEVGDYHAMTFPENHFDAVIAIESLMHAIDLDKALLEFHRVLRPGGRIAISEPTKVSSQARVPMTHTREPITADEWVAAFEAAGLVPEEWIQCGRRVFGQSGKRFPRHAAGLRDEFVAQFGEEPFEGLKEAMKGLDPGPEHMSYLILCARKPIA